MATVKMVNATPHTIHILEKGGILLDERKKTFSALPENVEVLFSIEPSGTLPRVSSTEVEGEPDIVLTETGETVKIPTATVVWGEIEGLPPEEVGVVYIVSSLVATAAKELGRTDCRAPLMLVRDAENGSNVLGCLKLGK